MAKKDDAKPTEDPDLFTILRNMTGVDDLGMDKAVSGEGESDFSPIVQQRRTEILEAALKIFAKKGFDGSRTKEIANQAGVSEATLFKYFPTKKNLLASIMKPVIETIVKPYFRDSITKIIDEAARTGLELCLVRIIVDRYELVQRSGHLIQTLFKELGRQEDFFAVFRQLALPLVTSEIDRLLAGAVDRGEIAPDVDPIVFRRNFMALAAGNIALMQLIPEHFRSKDIRIEIEESVKLFVHGLRGGKQ